MNMKRFVEPIPYTIGAYPLSMTVQTKHHHSPDDHLHTIIAFVPFPKQYPETPFQTAVAEEEDGHVALVEMVYDTSKHHLQIDYFYVYSTFARYKEILLPEERLPKGFGKFMLCRVMRYLIETSWFSPDATVSVTASGNQCYDMDNAVTLSFEDALTRFQAYPKTFLEHCRHMFPVELNATVQREIKDPTRVVTSTTIYDIYDESPELVVRCCREVFLRNETPALLLTIQTLVCKIATNQQLVERNYKRIYGFEVVDEHGTYAKMKGTVANIRSACAALLGSAFKKSPFGRSSGERSPPSAQKKRKTVFRKAHKTAFRKSRK